LTLGCTSGKVGTAYAVYQLKVEIDELRSIIKDLTERVEVLEAKVKSQNKTTTSKTSNSTARKTK